MINPLRSEEDAFRFTLIVAVLLAPVVLAAIVFSSGVAVGVGAGLALGVIGGILLMRRQEPQETMLLGRRLGGERRRILVMANETLTGEALRDEIAHRSRDQETEVRVVCPALNTKLKHWISDEDEARRRAHERLDRMLSQLKREGVEARGDIGDGDPVQAMEDALRLFSADEAIISTHPLGRSNWLEREVVKRARERFPLPITHVIVDLEKERELGERRAGERTG